MADVVIVNAQTGERTERAFTPQEAAQRAADQQAAAAQQAILDTLNTNRATLEAQATAALATNQTAINANPATVTLAQVAGQVQALSAQNNALIRLVLGLLDEVN
jgi:hypothetical protein